MAVGGCHCSSDRFVVCHFLLLIRYIVELKRIVQEKPYICPLSFVN